jgi:hypothetical protein
MYRGRTKVNCCKGTRQKRLHTHTHTHTHTYIHARVPYKNQTISH